MQWTTKHRELYHAFRDNHGKDGNAAYQALKAYENELVRQGVSVDSIIAQSQAYYG